MKKLTKSVAAAPLNQEGFIPMIICLILIVGIIIYFAFTRVLKAQN